MTPYFRVFIRLRVATLRRVTTNMPIRRVIEETPFLVADEPARGPWPSDNLAGFAVQLTNLGDDYKDLYGFGMICGSH